MGMGRAVQNNNMTGMQGKGGAARPAPQPARPVQQPVAGMGAKGVGQFPPQTQQPGMPNFVQPYYQDMLGQMQSQQQLPQTGMGAKGVGQFPPQTYPFPQPTVQQPPQTGMGAKGVGQFPPQTQQPGMPNFVQPYYQDMLGQMQSQQQLPQTGMGAKGVGQFPPQQPTPPRPVPVQPLRQPARPAPVAARPNPLRTPVPVRPEPKNVANQRALQQLAQKAKR